MPGIFGGMGLESVYYAKLRGEFQRSWSGSEFLERGNSCLGAHTFENSALFDEKNIIFGIDGERNIYKKALTGKGIGRALFSIKENSVDLADGCKGNVAIIDSGHEKLYIAVEVSGCYPLYYTHFKGGLLFSSLLKPLARTISAQIDHAGLLEYLRYGYTLHSRTFFKNIFRMLPGQTLIYDGKTKKFVIEEKSRIWSLGVEYDSKEALCAEFWTQLERAAGRCVEPGENTALMTSAGWDSRLLLAALRKAGVNLSCYVHGDLLSRELKITERMVRSCGLGVYKEPLSDKMYDLNFLRDSFDRSENVNFPHWHLAGRRLKEYGVKSVAAGILGEVCGGHYTRSMLMPDHKKMFFVASGVLRKKQKPMSAGNAADFLRITEFNRPWYVKKDFWESNASIKDSINEDIEASINRLVKRGITDLDRLIEAYITESRASRYISAQLLSCRGNLDIINIFGDRELLSFSSSIPLLMKIQNALSRAVIGKYAKDLLNFPTAAILVNADSPILLQEFSRLVRKTAFNLSWKVHFLTSGKTKPFFVGWDNFELLRNGRILQDLADNISNSYIEGKSLFNFTDKIKKGAWKGHLYNVSDQYMKIFSADLMTR